MAVAPPVPSQFAEDVAVGVEVAPLAITVPVTLATSVFCPAAQVPVATIVSVAPTARLPILPSAPRLIAPPLVTVSVSATLVSATLPRLLTMNSYCGAGPLDGSLGSPDVVVGDDPGAAAVERDELLQPDARGVAEVVGRRGVARASR